MKDRLDMDKQDMFEVTKSWIESELLKRTSISPEMTGIIFVGLINRTNTGALSTALGRSPSKPPITRHIQPFKAIARQLMESKGIQASTPLTFLKDTINLQPEINLIKETIGPNLKNPAEWVDAINILLTKNINPKQITFIPTFRNPIDTVASWKFMWGWDWENFPFESFNKSHEFVNNKISFAWKTGIKVVPYIHEFLRDFDRFDLIERICKTINIPFSPNMVQWENNKSNNVDNKKDPYFDGNMIKYDQPPERWIRGVLNVKNGGRGGLLWKPIGFKLELTEDEISFVKSRIKPAIEIHNKYVNLAKKILNL